MGKKIISTVVALLILGILSDMPYVVIGMATKCEIKLAWGKYLDVSHESWTKDWVQKCKAGPDFPKNNPPSVQSPWRFAPWGQR